ncbi:Asp-tRNA(Asn)/Glu-tRNA(Gln) amidotransferase subunit GatA [Candidatus Pacearchaeota archaeon]|nr:Asp-tRNA(Asn)/Glu-tRNA(Gln) amidotransferase subunit GatA [Candidatus Pacearchaeota archaeon]
METEKRLQIYLKEIEKNNQKGKKINAILQINPNSEKEAKEIDKKLEKGKAGKLAGKIIAVKANINVKNLQASCASLTLKDYISGYDASVIEKIKKEDGLIIGITNMDEFACGSSGETSAFSPCKNPACLDLIPGGSSSGSAAAVAAGFCDLALGSDTGGSIRNPASHCGVIGVKPSYGLVSRYGLIDLSMSLDQIGVFSKNIDDAVLLLNVIKGKDEKDATSFESKEIRLEKLNKITIGIPKINIQDSRINKLIDDKVNEIAKKNNWELVDIKLEHVNLGVQTYYPICYVEFFSGTRKFDGRRFGKKIEESCGEEVLRRILGGSEISKAEFKGLYYRRALKAKNIIKKEFEDAFKDVDVIIMPTVPRLPHKLNSKISVEEMYGYDVLTVLANLAEIPAISVPAGKIDNVPVGLQVLAPRFSESLMLSVAEQFSETK